jgi:hypothetical protein
MAKPSVSAFSVNHLSVTPNYLLTIFAGTKDSDVVMTCSESIELLWHLIVAMTYLNISTLITN